MNLIMFMGCPQISDSLGVFPYICVYRKKNYIMKLNGIALDRTVTIFTETITKKLDKKINWGYSGESCVNLAEQICNIAQIDLKLVEAFTRSIVANLPQEDFEVKIDLQEWVIAAELNQLLNHNEYITVKVGNTYIPNYIYFNYARFKTGVFGNDTVEYYHLAYLESIGKFKEIRNNLTTNTRRMNVAQEQVHTDIIYDAVQDVFFVSEGMGTGIFEGHKLAEVSEQDMNIVALIRDPRHSNNLSLGLTNFNGSETTAIYYTDSEDNKNLVAIIMNEDLINGNDILPATRVK